MRKRMRRAMCVFAALLLMGACLCAAAEASYSVRALPPENQADKDAWYFDMTVEPGAKQTLQALVMNLGQEEIEVGVEVCAAFTNCNGVIDFTNEPEPDPSLAVNLAQILIPNEDVVTVPAEGEAIMEFTLTVPEQPFDGVVYGGLLFTKLGQEPKEGQGAMGISNVYRFAIGARLRENAEDAEPEFELLSGEMDNGGMSALVLNLRNPAPVLARGIELRAELYKEGSDEPAATYARSGVDMAPNTLMPFRFDLMESELPEPGEYRVAVGLDFEDREWTFETALKVG